jgi:hypothetical protein
MPQVTSYAYENHAKEQKGVVIGQCYQEVRDPDPDERNRQNEMVSPDQVRDHATWKVAGGGSDETERHQQTHLRIVQA